MTRPDDSCGPWHDSLQHRELAVECLPLCNACYVLVAVLAMMRAGVASCESREMTKDGITEYFGTPAVKSVKRKLDPDLPTAHWWITAPVAQAIETAMQHTPHASGSGSESAWGRRADLGRCRDQSSWRRRARWTVMSAAISTLSGSICMIWLNTRSRSAVGKTR